MVGGGGSDCGGGGGESVTYLVRGTCGAHGAHGAHDAHGACGARGACGACGLSRPSTTQRTFDHCRVFPVRSLKGVLKEPRMPASTSASVAPSSVSVVAALSYDVSSVMVLSRREPSKRRLSVSMVKNWGVFRQEHARASSIRMSVPSVRRGHRHMSRRGQKESARASESAHDSNRAKEPVCRCFPAFSSPIDGGLEPEPISRSPDVVHFAACTVLETVSLIFG